ncbi:uncharacterized protein LOC131597146 [Vicia villosa]|uniref:uncharacterized protein LOC131597146 n=1 Tax=Vicia villosa TaxID=3911 RepID=UPI00273C76FB|nr:uncharacterized protein LOC131597146 [Vicia villosa]
MENDPFNTMLIHESKDWTDKIIVAIEEEEKILQQRAIADWIKLGDANNAYFHAIVRGRQKQNGIHILVDQNGSNLTEPKDMEVEVLRFYKDLVGTAATNLLHVDIEVLRQGTQLKDTSKRDLIPPITEQEVWKALRSIGSTKTPGLDGYNAKFFKQAWNIVKGDVLATIYDFFEHNHIQSTFLPGRVIHDNILMAYELLRGYIRKHISIRCAIQMDIQKAYDTVEWPALATIMRELNFPGRFIDWIMVCVYTVPYRSLAKLHQNPDFKFHPRCKKLHITTISFDDNLIVFTRGDRMSVNTMMAVFDDFSRATSLRAHPAKCKIYFGVCTIWLNMKSRGLPVSE